MTRDDPSNSIGLLNICEPLTTKIKYEQYYYYRHRRRSKKYLVARGNTHLMTIARNTVAKFPGRSRAAATASRRGVVVVDGYAAVALAEVAEVAIVSCPFVRGRRRRCACVRAGRHRGAERRTSRVRQV